jgi:hypothetical protein
VRGRNAWAIVPVPARPARPRTWASAANPLGGVGRHDVQAPGLRGAAIGRSIDADLRGQIDKDAAGLVADAQGVLVDAQAPRRLGGALACRAGLGQESPEAVAQRPVDAAEGRCGLARRGGGRRRRAGQPEGRHSCYPDGG